MSDFSFKIEKPDTETNIDYNDLAQLWNSAAKKMILVGVHYPNAALEILLDKVADDPSVLVLTETTSNLNNKRFINSIDNLIFIAEHEGLIIGACMAGYDGHRGWLYAVAVCKEQRRSGAGSALVQHAIQALKVMGCIKVNLQIRATNTQVCLLYTSPSPRDS